MTDSRGKPLEFGLGRALDGNDGIVAASRNIHASLLEVIQKVNSEGEAK